MKRTWFIASIIGLFMVTSLDLQARHGRRGLPRSVRDVAAIALVSQVAPRHHYDRDARYDRRQQRHRIREIQSNERRIHKLEKKIRRLYRRHGGYREIRELEREILWLERRNDLLRGRRCWQ